MTPAISTRQTNAAIINALVAAVQGVVWQAGPPAVPAFERVEFFDVEKLAEAFQFLLITEQRVCVIVPLEERFSSAINSPGKLVVTRELPVVLMISDRVFGDKKRQVALLGDNTTPGAQGLMELTLPSVTGMLLQPANGASGIKCIPRSAVVMTVAGKEQAKLPGRLCMAVELECTGGTLTAGVGPGPTL